MNKINKCMLPIEPQWFVHTMQKLLIIMQCSFVSNYNAVQFRFLLENITHPRDPPSTFSFVSPCPNFGDPLSLELVMVKEKSDRETQPNCEFELFV